MKKFITVFFLVVFFVSCDNNVPESIVEAYENIPENVDYNYHVKPILSDKCFACHGPDKANQKAGLRLDIAENAYASLEDNDNLHAIIPKHPNKSESVKRIFSSDKELIMPPPESNLVLSPREKAILYKWIEQGAQYKSHWAFIPPKKEEIPEIKNFEWAKNEIDFFVASKLEMEKLLPSKKATKETLIRRLYFDLTGLPPTIKEIEAFVNDKSNNAYEKIVDKLLNSPKYGERMAAEWLDVARYADSDGYLDDKHRDFSSYRDWVIKSFNSNMSYDEFTTFQLAGDLIPKPTKESTLATAFNRLHKKNSEAGIVFEEYRQEYVADRTLTVGKAFMGLSIECARCHDHKYDPISQKNYYQIAAFFNSTNEHGTPVYGPDQTPGPSLLLTNDEQEKVLDYINTNIEKTEGKLLTVEKSSSNDIQLWKKNTEQVIKSIKENLKNGLIAYYPFDKFKGINKKIFNSPNLAPKGKPVKIKEPEIRNGYKNNGVFLNDFTTITLPKNVGKFEHTNAFTLSLSIFPDIVYPEAGILYHCEDLRVGLRGYSLYLEENKPKFVIAHSWPTNAIQVKAKAPIPEKEWSNITISYDGFGKASGVHLYLNGNEIATDIEIDNLYKSILYKPNIHTYRFDGFTLGARSKMKTFIKGGIDELKIYDRELSGLEISYDFDSKKTVDLLKNVSKPENSRLISNHYNINYNDEAKALKENLKALKINLNQNIDTIPEIMVMGDLPSPRPTFILDRGAYDAPTEEVFPNVPEAILPFNENLPKNRLGLSKWLFDKNNPLTGRVFVNRLWQMHFGRGLVESSDDFGNQGSLPSHPKLLNWLAVTFREGNWDIKKIHKLIVTSATYQQSSKMRKDLLEIDTNNALLARGPNLRMTAEMIRDNALAISGLLSPKIGGKSVYPYQPKGLWEELSNKPWRYKYLQEPGEGLYRRSIYTVWKRTSPPPSMLIFDVNERGVCNVKRRQTSTPLQALVLLNDPQFIEASRILSENLILKHKGNIELQLKEAFKLSTGRSADNNEISILKKFHQDELKRFISENDNALAYTNIGNTPIHPKLNPTHVAALAIVINGIMNTTDSFTLR